MKNDVEKFIEKSKLWQDEMWALREIILSLKLEENLKWRLPCYSYEGGNVVIFQPFKSSLRLMFFKAALLKDPKGILIDNGPNSQSSRRIEFTSVGEVKKLKGTIKAYIKEAIALEKSGAKVEVKRKPLKMPEELTQIFAKNAKFKKAFEALTPGRQRGYLIHFSGAKQPQTRIARIEKCKPKVFAGKGLTER